MQPQDDLIGKMLGNYHIRAVLGQGGMARVYKAYQGNLDREVAVKVLPPWYVSDRNFVERFNQEARLIARLSHPNIVTVHDASEAHGHLYIVMQLIDGGTLKRRMDAIQREGKMMDLTEVVSIFSQLADALTYAHAQGVIHRDVKPVNVLMEQSGRPILSDFGIAKVLASTKTGLTHPGAGVGTPEYMSPEQCQSGVVDGHADIYALGVMLFESQTGRTPFIADNYASLAHSHIYEQPPRPTSINPLIHPIVERVILRCLMKHPQQRYQTPNEMAEALKQALQPSPAPIQPQQQPPSQPLPPAPFIPFAQQPITYSPPYPQSGINILEQEQRSGNQAFACYNCQHLNQPQVRFCTRCGYMLNPCRVCGERNPVSYRFCAKCGQPLIK